jgi:hypothetical protein
MTLTDEEEYLADFAAWSKRPEIRARFLRQAVHTYTDEELRAELDRRESLRPRVVYEYIYRITDPGGVYETAGHLTVGEATELAKQFSHRGLAFAKPIEETKRVRK